VHNQFKKKKSDPSDRDESSRIVDGSGRGGVGALSGDHHVKDCQLLLGDKLLVSAPRGLYIICQFLYWAFKSGASF
jgi:hypothetical protein